MKHFKVFTHGLLLITTPTSFLAADSIPQNIAQTTPNPYLEIDSLLMSFDAVIELLEQVESGAFEENCSSEEYDRVTHLLVRLAREGLLTDSDEEKEALENDIQELLSDEDPTSYEYSFELTSENGYKMVLCKGKSKKKKKKANVKTFCKDHKKALLIGALILVAATVVVAAVVVTSTAAVATAAATSAGAAISSHPSKKTLESKDTVLVEAPTLHEALNDNLSNFKEFAQEDIIFQSLDYTKPENDPCFWDRIKSMGSILAHETLEGISEITSIVPQLEGEIKELGKFLPEAIRAQSNSEFMGDPMENLLSFIDQGHGAIDQAFSTEQAHLYSQEAKENTPFAIGILPPPGGLPKGLSTNRIREILETGKEAIVLAEELGYSAQEIIELQKTGKLDKELSRIAEKVYHNAAMQASFERFKEAEALLKPFNGKYMPESQAKKLIESTGIRTFPRPKGIPKNYRVKLSNSGAGIKYVNPKDESTYVRIMPGKPHSKNPCQRTPYVNHRVNGQSLDKHGNLVTNNSPEAHIPVVEYVYRRN